MEIANLVSPGRDLEPINEGEEPQGFWDALGGKGPYTTVQPDPPPMLKARLFHCILSSAGRLRVEEIKPFKQEVRKLLLGLRKLSNFLHIYLPTGLG